jgi:hypothetical protein
VTAPANRTERSHPQDAGTAHPPRLGPLVQYALLAGPLLSMLDSSIVNVAVEPIARELHASLSTVQWTVSGYLLALGAGLAGTAYLARRFGTGRAEGARPVHGAVRAGLGGDLGRGVPAARLRPVGAGPHWATRTRCSTPGSGSPDRSA